MSTSKLTRVIASAAALAAITLAAPTAAFADPTDAEARFRQSEIAFINQQPDPTDAEARFRQSEIAFINQPTPAPAQPEASAGHGLNGYAVAAILALFGVATAVTTWRLTGHRPRPREAA